MVAPQLVPVLQGLLSGGLFLDAAACGAITPLLPFFVAAFHGSEQTIANLLAVGYGATLAAMVPSALLLLYTGHVFMLALGLIALQVSCALLGLNQSLWQLYGAMVLTGVSSEFVFAAALAMVAKLHAAPKGGEKLAGAWLPFLIIGLATALVLGLLLLLGSQRFETLVSGWFRKGEGISRGLGAQVETKPADCRGKADVTSSQIDNETRNSMSETDGGDREHDGCEKVVGGRQLKKVSSRLVEGENVEKKAGVDGHEMPVERSLSIIVGAPDDSIVAGEGLEETFGGVLEEERSMDVPNGKERLRPVLVSCLEAILPVSQTSSPRHVAILTVRTEPPAELEGKGLQPVAAADCTSKARCGSSHKAVNDVAKALEVELEGAQRMAERSCPWEGPSTSSPKAAEEERLCEKPLTTRAENSVDVTRNNQGSAPGRVDVGRLLSSTVKEPPQKADELKCRGTKRIEKKPSDPNDEEPKPQDSKGKEPTPKDGGHSVSVLTAVKGLLLSPYALPAILIVFVEAITMGAVDALVPLFLMDTCHRSAAESGLIFGALALTYAAVAYLGTSRLMASVGDIHTMVLGTVAMGLVLPVMALRALCSLWAQMLVVLPIGLGMALMGGPTFPRLVRALKLKGTEDDGVAVILYDGLYSGGMIVGPFVGLSLRKLTSTATVLQILSGILALTVALIYGIEFFSTKERAEEETSDAACVGGRRLEGNSTEQIRAGADGG